MSRQDMFGKGSQPWFEFWRERLQVRGANPVQVETRFEFKDVWNIDIESARFHAKLLVHLRIKDTSIYDGIKRQAVPNQPHCVVSGSLTVQEFNPWIEIVGNLDCLWDWVRQDAEGSLIYAYEYSGSFPLGRDEGGFFFPFDLHELTVELTSNWDSSMLIFVPWGAEWGKEVATASLKHGVSVVENRCSRVRKTEIENSLRHKWRFSSYPRLHFCTSHGVGKFAYSQVRASIIVRRLAFAHLITNVLRPLSLAGLTAASTIVFENSDELVAFNASILIAMSVSIAQKDSGRVTMTDLYKLGSFLFAVASFCTSVLGLDRSATLAGLFSILVGLNVSFILGYLTDLPRRNSLWAAHNHKASSATVVGASDLLLQKMGHGHKKKSRKSAVADDAELKVSVEKSD